MSSSRQFGYYGLTTAQFTVGISAITEVTDGAAVLDLVSFGTTGGTVYMTGQSLSVADTLANGVRLPTSIPHFLGASKIYLAAETTPAIVFIAKKLSQGFSGS